MRAIVELLAAVSDEKLRHCCCSRFFAVVFVSCLCPFVGDWFSAIGSWAGNSSVALVVCLLLTCDSIEVSFHLAQAEVLRLQLLSSYACPNEIYRNVHGMALSDHPARPVAER